MSYISYAMELNYKIRNIEDDVSKLTKELDKAKDSFILKYREYIKGDIIRIKYTAIVKGDYNYPVTEERYITGADIKINPTSLNWDIVYYAKKLNKNGGEDRKSAHRYELWHSWLIQKDITIEFINHVPRSKGSLLEGIENYTEANNP